MRKLGYGIAGCFVCVLLASSEAKGQLPPNKRYLPHVLNYAPKLDSFTYRDTSTVAQKHEREGYGEGYYGNRLTQFGYLGPPGTGGLYDALDDYKLRLNLNPDKSKYRPAVNHVR